MSKKQATNILSGLLDQAKKPVDNIPAKLTENEYVIPADVVHIMGHGNPKKGENVLDKMVLKHRRRAKRKLKKLAISNVV